MEGERTGNMECESGRGLQFKRLKLKRISLFYYLNECNSKNLFLNDQNKCNFKSINKLSHRIIKIIKPGTVQG